MQKERLWAIIVIESLLIIALLWKGNSNISKLEQENLIREGKVSVYEEQARLEKLKSDSIMKLVAFQDSVIAQKEISIPTIIYKRDKEVSRISSLNADSSLKLLAKYLSKTN